MDKKLTYFISDIHLGSRCIADPRAHERIVADWLLSIEPTARALYILGDALDFWYEYRTVVPRGFVRFFGALARLADAGVEITWLKGNHDVWIYDYLPTEIGLRVVDGVLDTVIDGRRFVMEHGDGAGEPRASYRRMQRIFRNRTCQRLFAAIHPRWTVEFAHRWSAHSREGGQEASPVIGEDDPLLIFARRYVEEHGSVDFFVFGHRHIKAEMRLENGSTLILLGDAFRQMTYGVFDGENFDIRRIYRN